MTTTTRRCPECHAEIPADAPPGVCPYCALRAGLRWDASPDDHVPRTPLAPERLAEGLPDLEAFELIGPGGMGTVYRARHRALDRPVAVKVLHAHLQEDATFVERFLREARTLARLDHPHIVRVHDAGHRHGIAYLVMELVDGVTLRQAMNAQRFTPEEALALVPPICDALQYAHDQEVVHRDIKPENILIDSRGIPKIADFGLALLTDSSAETRLTRTAQVMGTPHYMAPEQIRTPDQVDHRADIYALGVVFYELLTGELPVGRFPLPSEKVRVDVRLDEVVLRTLEREPHLRYQRADDVSREVASLSTPPVAELAGGGAASGSRSPRSAAETPGPSEMGTGWVETPRGWRRTGHPRRRYEYRSKRCVWGLPLVHIATGDADGQHMALARGIVAIGDSAVGLVALGGLAVGGIAIGGLGVGLVTISGLALGLLLAVGGITCGLLSFGSLAFGFVARGVQAIPFAELSPALSSGIRVGGWALVTLFVTLVVGCVIRWSDSAPEEDPPAWA